MNHECRLGAISGSVRVKRLREVHCRKARPGGIRTPRLTPPVNHLVSARYRVRSRWDGAASREEDARQRSRWKDLKDDSNRLFSVSSAAVHGLQISRG